MRKRPPRRLDRPSHPPPLCPAAQSHALRSQSRRIDGAVASGNSCAEMAAAARVASDKPAPRTQSSPLFAAIYTKQPRMSRRGQCPPGSGAADVGACVM